MTIKAFFFLAFIITLMPFSGDQNTIEFNYPKNKDATIIMTTDIFGKFSKEWRGEDYYYVCETGKNNLICSVLFYKLNKDEQKLMVDPFDPAGGTTSPIIPYTYFLESNLKPYERNKKSWGEATDEFMFRQNDIPEFNGMKIKQKHMYAYCMFGKDLFVNVHLSKTNYTVEDSTAMRKILKGLKKAK